MDDKIIILVICTSSITFEKFYIIFVPREKTDVEMFAYVSNPNKI